MLLPANPGRTVPQTIGLHGRMETMAEHIPGTDTPDNEPQTVSVPDKPALEGLESKLSARWREEGTYAFEPDTVRDEVYSIDTPPPTASGSLHVGHMFSYTQTDVMARYKRMTGKNVFYPMGWDDNGLPTERRVQNYYGVRCDPTKPYDADYRPPAKAAKNQRDFDVVSRRNFIELCEELAVEDEKVFEDLFSTLGLSVDWKRTYRTIDDHSRAVSSAPSWTTCAPATPTRPKHPPFGTSPSAPPWPRPNSRIASSPAPTTG